MENFGERCPKCKEPRMHEITHNTKTTTTYLCGCVLTSFFDSDKFLELEKMIEAKYGPDVDQTF